MNARYLQSFMNECIYFHLQNKYDVASDKSTEFPISMNSKLPIRYVRKIERPYINDRTSSQQKFSHPLTSATGRIELAGTAAVSFFSYQGTTRVKRPRNFRLTRTAS